MSLRFKEERCECGANLKDIEPIDVLEGEIPTARCPSCWEVHEVERVEEPAATPEPEPVAATEAEPAAPAETEEEETEPGTEEETEPGTNPATEPETEPATEPATE